MSISPCCFWEETTICKKGNAFRITGYSVLSKISGHLWVHFCVRGIPAGLNIPSRPEGR